jgi:hypothetical protein
VSTYFALRIERKSRLREVLNSPYISSNDSTAFAAKRKGKVDMWPTTPCPKTIIRNLINYAPK